MARPQTKTFSPIFGPCYGPNEEDMIGELNTFLRTKREGALPLSLIFAEMSPYYKRLDITFLKIGGKACLMPADGGDELMAIEEGDCPPPRIYSFARYIKKTDRIVALGPLPIDDRFKRNLVRVLTGYYRDALHYGDIIEEGGQEQYLIRSQSSQTESYA